MVGRLRSRAASAAVGVAVAAVVGAAAWDSLRSDEPSATPAVTAPEPVPQPVAERAPDADVVAALRRARVSGTWTYAARCETRTVRLPDLADEGRQLVVAPCDRGTVATLRRPEPFVTREGPATTVIARCDPGGGDDCGVARVPTALLDGLGERLGIEHWQRRDATVRDVAWFGDGRVALLVDLDDRDQRQPVRPFQVVVTLDGDELVGAIPTGRQTLTRLEASPRGTYVTARPDLVLDSDGGLLLLPFAIGGETRAVAWSPDERWTVFAASSGTFLVRTTDLIRLRETGFRPGLIRVPLVVDDLVWERG